MKSSRSLPFFKIQAAGNDFVVVFQKDLDALQTNKSIFVKKIADRHLGIGCDQVLEVKPGQDLAIDIWNADGSQAEMCANGSRAFANLARVENLFPSREKLQQLIVSQKKYSVTEMENGNFAFNLDFPQYMGLEHIEVFGNTVPMHIVHAPNPHAVVFLGDGAGEWSPPGGMAHFEFAHWGKAIENHVHFPNRTNVEFIYRVTHTGSKLKVVAKVWERGAGATLSSGSGSTAVAHAVWEQSGAKELPVEVEMNGFYLDLSKNEKGQTLLSGPSSIVAKGEIFI